MVAYTITASLDRPVLCFRRPGQSIMNAPVGALPPLPAHKDRRGWLIAFGVAEILIACFFLFMAIVTAALIPNMPRPAGQPAVPSGLFLVIGAFYGLLG